MTQTVTSSPEGARITVPPRRVRAVSIGLAIAIAFTGTSVGFAIGRLTAPSSGISSGVPGGGFPGAPGGGFPGGGGGFPGGGAPAAP